MLEINRGALMGSAICVSSGAMYRNYVATVMSQVEAGASYAPSRTGAHVEKLRFCAGTVYGAYMCTHDADEGDSWVAEIMVPAPPGILVLARKIHRDSFWEKDMLRRMARSVVYFKDVQSVERRAGEWCGRAAGE